MQAVPNRTCLLVGPWSYSRLYQKRQKVFQSWMMHCLSLPTCQRASPYLALCAAGTITTPFSHCSCCAISLLAQDPEEKGHCPRPFPKPKEQLVSPGRGRLRPAPSAPSQRSAALGDRHGSAVSCRTPLHRQHVGSPEQLIGRQPAPFPPAFV